MNLWDKLAFIKIKINGILDLIPIILFMLEDERWVHRIDLACFWVVNILKHMIVGVYDFSEKV